MAPWIWRICTYVVSKLWVFSGQQKKKTGHRSKKAQTFCIGATYPRLWNRTMAMWNESSSRTCKKQKPFGNKDWFLYHLELVSWDLYVAKRDQSEICALGMCSRHNDTVTKLKSAAEELVILTNRLVIRVLWEMWKFSLAFIQILGLVSGGSAAGTYQSPWPDIPIQTIFTQGPMYTYSTP